jgi:hypothetical protein
VELQAEVYGHEPGRLRATLHEFTPALQRRRALRTALPLLLGALVSLPIPGWHFVGVPGFLIAAVMLGRKRLRQRLEVVGVSGACPACGDEVTLPEFEDLPATTPCPACAEYLQLSELR